MKRVFTAWRSLDGSQISLVPGEGPPRFSNGEPQSDCEVMIWRIEVGSYEEAMAIRNLRLGYEPYVPQARLCLARIVVLCTTRRAPDNAGTATMRGSRRHVPAMNSPSRTSGFG